MMAKPHFLAIWTQKGIFVFIIFPIVYMKSIVLMLLFLLFSILIVCNKWCSIAILDDVFIILFTAIPCICHDVFRKLKKVTFNSIEKRNRSEEHTSELQSRGQLVCRLLLDNKEQRQHTYIRNRKKLM